MPKTNRSRRKGKHPMSAGAREPNGRPQRETTRAARLVVERCDPTPELVRQIERVGYTCLIQRAVSDKHITPMQAQAVESFAAIRRKVGMAEKTPTPVEGRQQPQAPGREVDDDAQERAWSAYQDACQIMTRAQHDAIATLCDQRQPRVLADMQAGARALERFFVRGLRAA